MCHYIQKARGKFVGLHPFETPFIVGYKVFTEKNGILFSSFYCGGEYRYCFRETIDGLLCKEQITQQEINFGLPVRANELNEHSIAVQRRISAGYHIAPFDSKRYISTTKIPEKLSQGSLVLPVCFEADWVTFYDGTDVSCSKFLIPKASLLIKHNFVQMTKYIGVTFDPTLYLEIYDNLQRVHLK